MMGADVTGHVLGLAVRHAMLTAQSDMYTGHCDRDLCILLRGLDVLGYTGSWGESLAKLADLCEQAEERHPEAGEPTR